MRVEYQHYGAIDDVCDRLDVVFQGDALLFSFHSNDEHILIQTPGGRLFRLDRDGTWEDIP